MILSMTDLLQFLREKRGVVDPNIGFWRQLLRGEARRRSKVGEREV